MPNQSVSFLVMSRLLDYIAYAIIIAVIGVTMWFLGALSSVQAFPPRLSPFGYIGNSGPLLLVHQKLAANSWVDRESNFKGERCCDAGKDCHVVPPDRVMPRGDGVTLPDYGNITIPGNQIQISQDGQYWVCFWANQVKCFFAPYSGS
jgi:hypothetical protein